MIANLLIVEDDTGVQEAWKRTIERFNRRENTDLRFKINLVSSAQDAETVLRHQNIDCIITDLRLNNHDNPLGGEIVISEARKIAGAPIAIMSGYLQEYEETEEEMAPVRKFDKETDQYPVVLEWFNGLKQLIMISSQARERLREVYADLFHRALWKNWHAGTLGAESIDAKVRHLVTLISEEMTAGSAAKLLWPEEFYVRPALHTRLLTGDLLRIDDAVYVVVSPPCDLANTDNPESILMALCGDGYSNYNSEVADKLDSDKTPEKMRQYLCQDKVPPSLHFLPKHSEMGPWFASFKQLKCISRADLGNEGMADLLATRFASVSPLFVPNLTHRFASYLGRPGQPDIDPVAAIAACR